MQDLQQWILDIAEDEGPFDGVMGFSEVRMILLALSSLGDHCEMTEKLKRVEHLRHQS